jgi:Na+-driven multidrug efflux pump
LAVVEGSGSTMAGFWIEVITSVAYAISVYLMVKFTNWEVPILWLADYLYFIILGICSITFLRYGQWKNKMI